MKLNGIGYNYKATQNFGRNPKTLLKVSINGAKRAGTYCKDFCDICGIAFDMMEPPSIISYALAGRPQHQVTASKMTKFVKGLPQMAKNLFSGVK